MEQSLSDAFLEDHQHLTRGLSAILESLEADDLASAVRIGEELDRHAGPHMHFEEEYFYPKVGAARGRGYEAQLLQEHETGRAALQELLAQGGATPLDPEAKQRIISGLREALDHTYSCGTLLSHVTTLPAEEQQHLLDALLQLRAHGERWTDRGGHPAVEAE